MSFASQNRAAMNQAAPGTSGYGAYGAYSERASGANPPGAISATDRQRMLDSLTLDQMDAYAELDGPGRSAYEDHWLRTYPPGTTSNYALAEDVLNMASGTFNAILASNDRAQAAALAERVGNAVRALEDRIRAENNAPGSLAHEQLRLQLMTLQNNRDIALAQSGQQTIATQYYVIGGVAALAIAAAAFAYAASQSRKNPVVDRSNRRVFIPLELLTSAEQEAYRKSRAAKKAA